MKQGERDGEWHAAKVIGMEIRICDTLLGFSLYVICTWTSGPAAALVSAEFRGKQASKVDKLLYQNEMEYVLYCLVNHSCLQCQYHLSC